MMKISILGNQEYFHSYYLLCPPLSLPLLLPPLAVSGGGRLAKDLAEELVRVVAEVVPRPPGAARHPAERVRSAAALVVHLWKHP